MEAHWAVVVPVKELHRAKTRLDGFTAAQRADLALAMAADVVSAARACPLVAGVVVVTNDVRAATALAESGARVVADSADAGINPALADGARLARQWWPRCGVAAVASDLACLRSDQLAEVLTAAAAAERCVVADARGDGTAILTARGDARLDPRFGAASCARHVAAGARLLSADHLPTVRRDVDTRADLAAAVRLGLNRETAAVLRRNGHAVDPAGA